MKGFFFLVDSRWEKSQNDLKKQSDAGLQTYNEINLN